MTAKDRAELIADLKDDPAVRAFYDAYHEQGLHKADANDMRERLSKVISDPQLLEDSLRLTMPMSSKDLHATVLSMFANPANVLATPVMSTVLLMLQQAGVSAAQAQREINAYFGKTLTLSFGKTADLLTDYDGVMVTRTLSKDRTHRYVCDGVNEDDPAPSQSDPQDDTSETCAVLPERTGPWKKFKKWVKKAVSDVADAIPRGAGGDGRTWQDLLNRIFGGALTGALYGAYLVGTLHAVVGLIIGGPLGTLLPPGLSVLEAVRFGVTQGLFGAAFGALFGGAISLYWSTWMAMLDVGDTGDQAEWGDFSGALVPENWPRVFQQIS